MSIAKSSKILPLAAMENIMFKAGASRVSEDAKSELKKMLEEYGETIAERAIIYARHAKRKTIKTEDILLAVKQGK